MQATALLSTDQKFDLLIGKMNIFEKGLKEVNVSIKKLDERVTGLDTRVGNLELRTTNVEKILKELDKDVRAYQFNTDHDIEIIAKDLQTLEKKLEKRGVLPTYVHS